MSVYSVPPARTTMAWTPMAASSGSNNRDTKVGARRANASAAMPAHSVSLFVRQRHVMMSAGWFYAASVDPSVGGVRGGRFDCGNTLFAQGPVALTMRSGAARLGLQMDED